MKEKDESTIGTRCPACKASISFNPTTKNWKCDYCGSEFTMEEINYANKKDFKKEAKHEVAASYIVYHCESCGAEIIADEQTAATFCIYCGNTAILSSKLTGEFAPDKIIPFQTDKQAAINAFKKISKGRPLVPKKFNNEKNIEKIKGVYIPFWLYDVNVSGNLVMDAQKTETWRIGKTTYTKTDYFKIERGGTMDFEKVPVDASTRFDNDIMNSIEPFYYDALVPYSHAYLSGFYAEKYDENPNNTFKEVKERTLNSAKDELIREARQYTTKTITSNTLEAKETSKLYSLFPVWMVNVKYNNKQYIFSMNGQTGSFIGDIPIDRGKAILYTILTFAGTLLICLIISYILYLGGNA